jgi:hypothetical protein
LEWESRAARGFPYCLVLQYQSPTLRVGFFYDQSLTLKQAWRSVGDCRVKRGFPYCLVLQYQSPTLRVGFFYALPSLAFSEC